MTLTYAYILTLLLPALFQQDTLTNVTIDQVEAAVFISLDFDSSLIEVLNQEKELSENFPVRLRKQDVRDHFAFFLYFILIVSAILLIFLSGSEYIRDLFMSVFSIKYFLSVFHKKKYTLLINNILLDVIFLSLIFIMLFNYSVSAEIKPVLEELVLLILLFHFSIVIVLFVFVPVFFGGSKANLHLKSVLLFNRAFSVVAAPVLFIAFYIEPEFSLYILLFIVILYLLLFIFRLFRIYFLLKKTSTYSFIYILLYLCVFEICPYIAIYKEFSVYLSLKL